MHEYKTRGVRVKIRVKVRIKIRVSVRVMVRVRVRVTVRVTVWSSNNFPCLSLIRPVVLSCAIRTLTRILALTLTLTLA